MRQLTLGNEGSINPYLIINVLDESGPGGANHEYEVTVAGKLAAKVSFQNGAISKPEDVNGATNESLLAIVIDRLQSFSKGPYPSRETSLALTKCEEALHWLAARTRERVNRGVEGRLEK